MTEIVDSVKRVNATIGEITETASHKVRASVRSMHRWVPGQMTQQNSALVEKARRRPKSLREQAQRLTQVVSTFKLERLSGGSVPTVPQPPSTPRALPRLQ